MNNTYRKKTVEFQAVQNTPENPKRLDSFLDEHGVSFDKMDRGLIVLLGPPIGLRVHAGEWVIRKPEGGWTVVSPAVFEHDYEPCDRGQEEEEEVTFLEVTLRVRTTRGDEVHTEKRSFEIETEQIVLAGHTADTFAEAIVAKASEHGVDLPRKP